MRSKRIEEMEDYIIANNTVTIELLCKLFGVSVSTLRRDLGELVERGNVRKIYGGVAAAPQAGQYGQLVPFEMRNITNAAEKKRIAERAASLVEDDDVIFIDSGTTTLYMVDFLSHLHNITVLTNNIDVLYRSITLENITVVTLSGKLNRKTLSLTGSTAVQVLSNYNISKAFLATTGFSLLSGVTNSSASETEIKKMAVQRSRQRILLADHTKVDNVALYTYCNLEQIDLMVTDRPLSAVYAAAFKERRITEIVAPEMPQENA